MVRKEEALIKKWIEMVQEANLPLDKIRVTNTIIKRIQKKKYLDLITEVRSLVAAKGIEESKRVLSTPYVVDFLFHKQDPDFHKAKWYGMIEYMTQSDGRVFMPSKKATDPVEKHYNEFLLLIKNNLNSALPFDMREAEEWPYMFSWILNERKQLEYAFTVRALEEIIEYQKLKLSIISKPSLSANDPQETKYAKLIAYMRMCYNNNWMDKFEPGFFQEPKAREWIGY